VFTFDTRYLNHSDHYNVIIAISNIINIDVDFVSETKSAFAPALLMMCWHTQLVLVTQVSPSCTLPSRLWGYQHGYYLLLIVAFLPTLLSLLTTGIAWVWSVTVKKHEVFGVHLPFMCDEWKQVRRLLMRCLQESVPFFGVVYNNVCLKAFQTFSCQQLRDGTYALRAAPSIICYDSYEHNVMVGISIVALIVYVFGIPAMTLGVTLYAHKTNQLKDPDYLTVFGIFYREYEPQSGAYPAACSDHCRTRRPFECTLACASARAACTRRLRGRNPISIVYE
jgi:hypothetical protein